MRCSICDGQIEVIGDWTEGHNAQPINNGRCCGVCNDTIVVPVRIKQMLNRRKPEDLQGIPLKDGSGEYFSCRAAEGGAE